MTRAKKPTDVEPEITDTDTDEKGNLGDTGKPEAVPEKKNGDDHAETLTVPAKPETVEPEPEPEPKAEPEPEPKQSFLSRIFGLN